jgi:hypothetical protein
MSAPNEAVHWAQFWPAVCVWVVSFPRQGKKKKKKTSACVARGTEEDTHNNNNNNNTHTHRHTHTHTHRHTHAHVPSLLWRISGPTPLASPQTKPCVALVKPIPALARRADRREQKHRQKVRPRASEERRAGEARVASLTSSSCAFTVHTQGARRRTHR